MADRLFIAGKLTDLRDPRQLGRLNDLLAQILSVLNQFDPNSFALAWIEGAAVGQVIASAGVGSAPVWSANPTLTGATFSGLGASLPVKTTGAKALSTGNIVESEQTLADNTTNDVLVTRHGYCPKAPNDTTKYLRGDASWQTVPVTQISTGWSVTAGYTSDKAFNPETAGFPEVARVLGTLIDDMKAAGYLGA